MALVWGHNNVLLRSKIIKQQTLFSVCGGAGCRTPPMDGGMMG